MTSSTINDQAEWIRVVIASAMNAFVSMDAEGCITEWNPQAEATFGWAFDDVVGKRLVDMIVLPAHREAHLRRFAASLEGGDAERHEAVALHRDGHAFPVEFVLWTVRVGDALVANTSIRDLTERAASMVALQANERRLQEAAELAKVGHWEWDVARNEMTWTDQTYRNFGYEPGAIEPSVQAFFDRVHPDDLERVKSAVLGSQPSHGVPLIFEHRVATTDGSVKWLYNRSYFEFGDGGQPVRLFGVVQDITFRKLGEESVALLAAVVRSSEDAVFTATKEGCISSWNAGAERLFGYSSEEAIGLMVSRLCPPELLSEQITFRSRVSRKQTVSDMRTQRLHRDGSRIDVSVSGSPIVDAGGDVIASAAIVRDISASKAAENALQDAFEREQETVAQLHDLDRARSSFVATVSHELRTPLTSILGYLELLTDEPLRADHQQMLKVVDRNSKRLLRLIEDLLEIGRIDSGSFGVAMEPVAVGSVVERACAVMRPSVSGRGQGLDVDIGDDVGWVRGDAVQLEQVLTNLLVNSAKFTPRGGRIRVVAERDAGDVSIAISDTGMGIGEDDLTHVFEPFYRSPIADQRAIQGTGLGLAIVKAILRHHNGTISCASREGDGTTMTVHIPRIERTSSFCDHAPSPKVITSEHLAT